MLILLFRGIFLIGILSWYSANVWKMIDGYFKDSFEKYLQQEYRKNPKMREDVSAYQRLSGDGDNGKVLAHDGAPAVSESDVPKTDPKDRSCETLRTLDEETCPIDYASVETTAADARTGSGSLSMALIAVYRTDDGRASKSEVSENGLHRKNAFTVSSSVADAAMYAEKLAAMAVNDNAAKSTSAVRESNDIGGIQEIVIQESTTKTDDAHEAATTGPIVRRPSSSNSDGNSATESTNRKPKRRRSLREKTKSDAANDMENTRKKKKTRVKTITLTDDDIKQAMLRAGLRDNDFSEFDDDNDYDDHEASEGILVSQLPFKPRADIGNLERVTSEEYCPLTLDDEVNCDETRAWN